MLKRLFNRFKQMLVEESRKRVGPTEESSEIIKRPRKPKEVKYAMSISYQGHDFYGLQYQKDSVQFPTVESHLLDAMFKHGFITSEQRDDLFGWYFQRAARTDRGVSAVRNMLSMRLPINDNFIENGVSLLNSSLPDDIRVVGIKRVVPSFHAQKYCDGRTYSYTLPSFSFASCEEVTTDAYRIKQERIEEVNKILDCFRGTHNFFNYTSQKEFSDQSSRRHIFYFKCEQPFIYNDPITNRDIEFITLFVNGQSFMLHQIRKMIGAALCIVRGFMYKSDIVRSFQNERMDIPRAPGLGLLLEKLHYNRYDTRFEKTHGSLNDWGVGVEKAVKEARDKLILPRILREECQTQSMMKWLDTLQLHQYITTPYDLKGESLSALRQAALNVSAKSTIEEEDSLCADDDGNGDAVDAEMCANGGGESSNCDQLDREEGKSVQKAACG